MIDWLIDWLKLHVWCLLSIVQRTLTQLRIHRRKMTWRPSQGTTTLLPQVSSLFIVGHFHTRYAYILLLKNVKRRRRSMCKAALPGNRLPGNMLPSTCCLLPATCWSNMLSATKLLPVCCPSVAGYKGIHVAEIQATCCRNKQYVARQHVACCRQHVARTRNMLPGNMLPWCKRGLSMWWH